MNNREIIKIIEKEFNEKPIKIVESSTGVDHIVKIIHTKNNKYVIKFPKKEKLSIRNQAYASKMWREVGVPVPKILAYTGSYLIESFVEGITLNKIKLTNNEKKKIYFQLGKIMKKMHSVKTQGYGPFVGGKKGKYNNLSSYRKWSKNRLKESIDFLKERGLLSIEEINKLSNYVKTVQLPNVQYVLTHQDLCEDHIYIKDKRVSGIIDLADIKSDDPASDFRRLGKYDDSVLEPIINGYGNIDMKRIRLHRFLVIVYMIKRWHEKKRYTKIKKSLKKMMEYVYE